MIYDNTKPSARMGRKAYGSQDRQPGCRNIRRYIGPGFFCVKNPHLIYRRHSMKRFTNWLGVVALVTLMAGTAHAESIAGRVGVTGRIGFLVPADSEFKPNPNSAKQNIG